MEPTTSPIEDFFDSIPWDFVLLEVGCMLLLLIAVGIYERVKK